MLLRFIRGQNRIFGLDLMRAAAILLVLFGHCAWIFGEDLGVVSQLMALSGYLGVEIFFVLSGYLIGGILLKMFLGGNFTLASAGIFLRRRWFRTLPNYFLVLLINIGIAAWLGYQIDDLWKFFFFLQNFAQPLLPFFPESWSLSVEEFAYIILPTAIFFAGLLFAGSNKSRVFISTVLLCASLCILAKVSYHSNFGATTLAQWNLSLKSVVIFRLDAIFCGVIFAWIHRNFQNAWKNWKVLAFFAGCAMLAFFTFGVGMLGLFIDKYPFFWNVLYLPMTSLGMALFLPVLSQWEKASQLLSYPVTFISLVSYSVYLLHYSVILQVLKHFIDSDSLSLPGKALFTTGYLLLTFCCSALLFRYFEKPVTDLRDGPKIHPVAS